MTFESSTHALSTAPPDLDEASPGFTRRAVVQVGAAAGFLMAMGAPGAAQAAQAVSVSSPRRVFSFDDGWRFFEGVAPGAQAVAFPDGLWVRTDLPHDFSIDDRPGGSDDGSITSQPANSISSTAPLELAAPTLIGPFDKNASPQVGFKTGKQVAWTVAGEGWYRKEFTVADLGVDDRVEVQFDGAYCNVTVWLNGVNLGFVANGYVPFDFDLTANLNRTGSNVLAVRVQNVGQTSRWYSGSGIYRHTRLVVSKPVRIPRWGVTVTTPTVSSVAASVRVSTQVENHRASASTVSVRSTVMGPTGAVVSTVTSPLATVPLGGGTSTFLSSHSISSPRRWDVNAPNLYTVRTEVLVGKNVLDSTVETFGIRSVSFDQRGMILNGRSIKMRGGNIHQDFGALGSATTYRSEERRIQLLKAAGFNAIRTAHGCPSPQLREACDRLGMLVYDEFTDVWETSKNDQDYSASFTNHWREDMSRWIRSGRNSPSVIIWSIGNEIAASGAPISIPVPNEAKLATGIALSAAVRALDPTRPIVEGGGQGIFTSTEATYIGYVDIGDIHYMHSYGDLPSQNPSMAFVQSESFQSTIFQDWRLVEDNDYVIGDFCWTAWDYLGEAGVGATLTAPVGTEPLTETLDPETGLLMAAGAARYPWFTANCGDLDLIGQRRTQNLYRNVVWGRSNLALAVERPLAPGLESQAFGWSWYDELESWTWDVPAGYPMRVRAYSAGDSVALLLNGLPIARKTLTPADRMIAVFDVPFAPGQLVAVAYRNGVELARTTLKTVGAPASLRLTADRANVTTSRDDLAHLLIEVVDAAGKLVPDAVKKVQLSVVGGKLIGFSSANGHNMDSFTRPRRHTYHGQALAIIRPPRTAGTITVNAFSSGLTATSLRLPVIEGSYPRI